MADMRAFKVGRYALPPVEELARLFHEAYERLAPDYGYRTRDVSAKPWSEVPTQNKGLMIATVREVLDGLSIDMDVDGGRCALVCRGCSADSQAAAFHTFATFNTYGERREWAAGHAASTGHRSWLRLDGWPSIEEVADLPA